jgi:SSS family solute:Na+ symporter
VGTTLWAFYSSPDVLARIPTEILTSFEETPERIVPYFTAEYLPAGLVGLIIAAVMAASMSSLDSSINAVSTAGTTDVMRRYLLKNASERSYLLVAKTISAIAGAGMIGIALMILNFEGKESIVDWTRQALAIFGGVVGGIFLLAIFVRRVGPSHMLAALPFALAIKAYVGIGLLNWIEEAWRLPIHNYWVGVVSNVTLMILAYLFSFLWVSKHAEKSKVLPPTQPTADEHGDQNKPTTNPTRRQEME